MYLSDWQQLLEYMSGYRVAHEGSYVLVEDLLAEGITIPLPTTFDWGFDGEDKEFKETRLPFGDGTSVRFDIDNLTFVVLFQKGEVVFSAFPSEEVVGLTAPETAYKITSLEPVKTFNGVAIIKALGRITSLCLHWMEHTSTPQLGFFSATDYVDQLYRKIALNKSAQAQLSSRGFEFTQLRTKQYAIIRKEPLHPAKRQPN